MFKIPRTRLSNEKICNKEWNWSQRGLHEPYEVEERGKGYSVL